MNDTDIRPAPTPALSERFLRGVSINVSQARLLLPNASISEVISYSDPEPLEDAPAWLLGRVRWQGWELPLLSFPRLIGELDEGGKLGAKVTILKLLGGKPRLSFLALLTQGFPRLVTIRAEALEDVSEAHSPVPGVLYRVDLDGEPAIVPDLDAIETMIDLALPQAA